MRVNPSCSFPTVLYEMLFLQEDLSMHHCYMRVALVRCARMLEYLVKCGDLLERSSTDDRSFRRRPENVPDNAAAVSHDRTNGPDEHQSLRRLPRRAAAAFRGQAGA